MLLEFTVNNFKSIKDTVKFSMLKISKDEKDNTFDIRGYKLLKSAVLYGANASGKSNFLKAMSFMSVFVLNRYKIMQSTDKLPHEPFRLSSQTENASSSFEIVFFANDIKYRYGFEIDNETVYSEWLYADEKGKEAKLFYRDTEDKDYVNPNKFTEGYTFFDKQNEKIKISKNQLFIWKCDQNDGDISKSILHWFNNFNMLDASTHQDYMSFAMEQMENQEFKEEIVKLVKTADIGIDDIVVEEKDVSMDSIDFLSLPKNIRNEIAHNKDKWKSITLNTMHKKFDIEGNVEDDVIFELEKEESRGTRQFFALSTPILDTLKNGKILIVDELDASLHPSLTKHLVKLFHDNKVNTNNAQLIFSTHDTNLLNKSIFRRDQIWLSEKNKYGSTDLYSLAQFKSVRENENFEKQYIFGKYGAIPYLGKFEF